MAAIKGECGGRFRDIDIPKDNLKKATVKKTTKTSQKGKKTK